MNKISDINNYEINKENLLKNYVVALKDENFLKLVNKLKISEDIAIKYTSKLETTVCELENCKKCRSLLECKNKVTGSIYYPTKEGDKLRFNYVTCKYKNKHDEEEKNKAVTFSLPREVENATLKDLDLTDKNRANLMKWINNFYKNYENGKSMKGLYLHGSFGSGKSFILSALLNELAKKGIKSTIIYYPEMLRVLKESFNDDFKEKMNLLKTSEILLIDDIGAESVSSWSRDEILGTILQYRMDSNLTTFFTSNLNIEELSNHLSQTKSGVEYVKAERIIERIKYLTIDMELISQNRRK